MSLRLGTKVRLWADMKMVCYCGITWTYDFLLVCLMLNGASAPVGH